MVSVCHLTSNMMEVDFQDEVRSKMDSLDETNKIKYLEKHLIRIKESLTFRNKSYFANLLSKVTEIRLKTYISYVLDLNTPNLPMQKCAKLFNYKAPEIAHSQLYKVMLIFCFLSCEIECTNTDTTNNSQITFEQSKTYFKISSKDYMKNTFMYKDDYSLKEFTDLKDHLTELKAKIKIFSDYSVSNYFCYSFNVEAQQITSDIFLL